MREPKMRVEVSGVHMRRRAVIDLNDQYTGGRSKMFLERQCKDDIVDNKIEGYVVGLFQEGDTDGTGPVFVFETLGGRFVTLHPERILLVQEETTNAKEN